MKESSLKQMERILWKIFLVCGLIAGISIFLLIRNRPSEVTEEEGPQEEGLADATYWLPTAYEPAGLLPEIIFEDSMGKKHTVSEWKGTPVILVFWASWCEDCQEQMTYMKEYMQLAQTYGTVSFLFINKTDGERETKETAGSYFDSLELGADTYYSSPADSFERLGIHNIPTSIFLDEEGRMTACAPKQIVNPGEFEALLKNAVNGSDADTADFIVRYMTDEEGGIHSSYTYGGSSAAQPEVLSESQGLMLLYAVETENQGLFDGTLSYIKSYMWNGGLAAWKVENGIPSEVNALLDDLRIYKGLRKAEELWGGYQEDLDYCEDALLEYGLRKSGLKKSGYVDFYEADSGRYATRFTLCYGDLETMSLLASKDKSFEKAYETAERILEKGQISDDFPLYYSWYDYKTKRYEKDDLNTAEAMLTLLHLAEKNKLKDNSVQWLRQQMKKGGIKAKYSVTGEVVEGYDYESTAVYAIVAMIGEEIGDSGLKGEALKRMEKMKIADTNLVYNGAFGMADGSGITSFDQLMPLLAYTYGKDKSRP